MTYTEYKPYVIDTGYLFPPSLADFLGTEDEVHIFREVTEQLDIGCLDSTSMAWDNTLITRGCCFDCSCGGWLTG